MNAVVDEVKEAAAVLSVTKTCFLSVIKGWVRADAFSPVTRVTSDSFLPVWIVLLYMQVSQVEGVFCLPASGKRLGPQDRTGMACSARWGPACCCSMQRLSPDRDADFAQQAARMTRASQGSKLEIM